MEAKNEAAKTASFLSLTKKTQEPIMKFLYCGLAFA